MYFSSSLVFPSWVQNGSYSSQKAGFNIALWKQEGKKAGRKRSVLLLRSKIIFTFPKLYFQLAKIKYYSHLWVRWLLEEREDGKEE